MVPSNVNSPARASPSCRRRSTASMARHHPPQRWREKYAAAREVAEDQNEPQAATKYDELRLRAIAAQRAALQRLRARGEIGEEAFHRIQEELDWSELDAAPAGSFQSLAS
jgi:monovalent cation/hydrogen antiporter